MSQEQSFRTVAFGTLTISSTSAVLTGVYAAIRLQPHTGALMGAAAVNSGLSAATFFSTREYIISPLLTKYAPFEAYARRRALLSGDGASEIPETPTWSDMRRSGLLDSGISGTLTGGLLRGVKAGRSAILSGSLFGGALCVFLQYAFNEANITRLRFISERQATNGNAVVREPSVRSKYQTSESTHPEPGPWASLLQLVGLKSISDEEFLERLKRRREVFQGRIAELEKQAEEERVMKELAQELQTERENSS